MKVNTRFQQNLPVLDSFFGLDIKLGATILTLFAVCNKVAGIYGVTVIFTGGTLAQLSLYLYSVGTLAVFIWGLKQISEENASKTLLYSHLFIADHLVSTLYSVFFFRVWYYFTPHDGRRADVGDLTRGWGGSGAHLNLPDDERRAAAEGVWAREKNFAALVLVAGWLIKIYFTLILYSFSHHLRQGTYHSLPASSSAPPPSRLPRHPAIASSITSFDGFVSAGPSSSRAHKYARLPQHSVGSTAAWQSTAGGGEWDDAADEGEAFEAFGGQSRSPVQGLLGRARRWWGSLQRRR